MEIFKASMRVWSFNCNNWITFVICFLNILDYIEAILFFYQIDFVTSIIILSLCRRPLKYRL